MFDADTRVKSARCEMHRQSNPESVSGVRILYPVLARTTTDGEQEEVSSQRNLLSSRAKS